MMSGPPPPRKIEGSSGSRIRIVLGRDREQWCLILNHDNGNTKWQERYWSKLPKEMVEALKECDRKGSDVIEMDLGGLGQTLWYVAATGGFLRFSGYCNKVFQDLVQHGVNKKPWKLQFGERKNSSSFCYLGHPNTLHNLSNDLEKRITAEGSSSIDFVRVFGKGAFFLQDDQGRRLAKRLPGCIDDKCIWGGGKEGRLGPTIHDLALADDQSWVVIGANGYAASGIDERLRSLLQDFYNKQLEWNACNQNKIESYYRKQEQERIIKVQQEEQKEKLLAARELDLKARAQAVEQAERALSNKQEQERLKVQQGKKKETLLTKREADLDARAEAIQQAERELSNKQANQQVDIRKREKLLEDEGVNQEAREQILNTKERDLCQRQEDIDEKANELAARQRSLEEKEQAANQRMEDLDERERSIQEQQQQQQSQTTNNEQSQMEGGICVICMGKPAEIAALPCGHLCFCRDCSIHYRPGGLQYRLHKPCPTCQGRIEITQRIFGLPSSQSY